MTLRAVPRFVLFVIGSILGAGLLAWAGAEIWVRVVYGVDSENRLVVYELRRQIGPGTTREEIERLMTGYHHKLEHTWTGDNKLSVWTHVGFMRACFLLVELREGKVVHASIRGDQGDEDLFRDAPADF